METINIHDAKTHLSKLVEKASHGESFIIAKAGKPMVRVTSIDSPEPGQVKRIGFLQGLIQVPDDFNQMGSDKVLELFEGKE